MSIGDESIGTPDEMTSDFPTGTLLPDGLVQPNAGDRLRAEDALAIHELIARVYLAEDSRDFTALRQLVTPDLVHDHSLYGRVDGPEGLVGLVRDHPERFDGLRHQAFNVATRAVGPDVAEAVSYILVAQLGGGDVVELPRILGHGVVRDRLVRAGGRWRIAHRVYDQFALAGAVVADADARSSAARHLAGPEESIQHPSAGTDPGATTGQVCL